MILKEIEEFNRGISSNRIKFDSDTGNITLNNRDYWWFVEMTEKLGYIEEGLNKWDDEQLRKNVRDILEED